MRIIDDDDVSREYMIEMGERFYMELYGKLVKKTDSFDHLREIMYQNTYKSLVCPPPIEFLDSICYVRI